VHKYYKSKKDDSHNRIVKMFKAYGFSVLDLSSVGGGCPDILVGKYGNDYLFEIKKPGGKLRPEQEKFLLSWRGNVHRIESFDEALTILKLVDP